LQFFLPSRIITTLCVHRPIFFAIDT
jgi:hypothetical protein